jgi:hypothetical protein
LVGFYQGLGAGGCLLDNEIIPALGGEAGFIQLSDQLIVGSTQVIHAQKSQLCLLS